MGAALDIALDEVTARKQQYKASGLEYFRPWLFIISDGAPTDGRRFDRAVDRVRAAEKMKAVTVFAVGVGDAADMAALGRLTSPDRPPLSLRGLAFSELFLWLSASMSTVSQSSAYGSSDSELASAEATVQTPLPPPGWATWTT